MQSAAGALRSTFRQGLVSHPYHNTIVMFIDGFDRVKSNNPAMHNAFCVLNKHTLRGIEQSCCFPQDTTKHEFRPKKLHISRLSVHFRDLYGRAYDFRGREHRFELRFEMCGTSSGPR